MKNKETNIFNIDENGVLIGLNSVMNIPDGVTKLSVGPSYGTKQFEFITEVNIPASCEKIDGRFIGCFDHAVRFSVSGDSKHFTSENGVLYTADKKMLVRYPSDMACDIFRVADEVEEIGEYAFSDAKNISGMYIGKNCRSIKQNAFIKTTYCTYEKSDRGGITGVGEYLGIRKYYVSPSVEHIANQIFEGGWCEDELFYEDIIVGGEMGSAIWEHCNACDIKFLEVKEEDAETFLATPFKELLKLHEEASNGPLSLEFTEEGFGGRLEDDTLELFVLDSTRKDVTVCQLDTKLPRSRYEKIKKLIIGDGISAIDKKAFWGYYDLDSVFFGADISDIQAGAFFEDTHIMTLAVDERNEHYKCVGGVIFSSDLKTLVMYPSGREDAYYEIPAHVEVVGEQCMQGSYLRCIKFGSNVKKIASMACYNTYGQHHFYVAPEVSEFEDDFIFGVDGKMRMCTCCWNLVVGGKAGSPIEKYCKETGRDGITFEVVEDDQIEAWLSLPVEPDAPSFEEEELLPF